MPHTLTVCVTQRALLRHMLRHGVVVRAKKNSAVMLQEAMMLVEEMQTEQMAPGSCDSPLLNVPNKSRSCLRPCLSSFRGCTCFYPRTLHAAQVRGAGCWSREGMEAACVCVEC